MAWLTAGRCSEQAPGDDEEDDAHRETGRNLERPTLVPRGNQEPGDRSHHHHATGESHQRRPQRLGFLAEQDNRDHSEPGSKRRR